MTAITYDTVYEQWQTASGFLIDGYVCGDWGLPSAEELLEAETADAEDGWYEWEPCVSFYVYGEHGLKREYFVDRKMIESGSIGPDGITVTYGDNQPLEIIPLYRIGSTETAAKVAAHGVHR